MLKVRAAKFYDFSFGYNDEEKFIEVFSTFSKVFGLDLRAQEQCFAQFVIVARTTPLQQDIHILFFVFLVTWKAHDEPQFNRFMLGQLKSSSVLQLIKNSEEGASFLSNHGGLILEAYLIGALLNMHDLRKAIGNYKKISESGELTGAELEHHNKIASFLEYFDNKGEYEIAKRIAKRIEMSERFRIG
jgi:hypothetical protein